MYNYLDIKNKDNIKSSNQFFSKWSKCNSEYAINADIVWLSDEGKTFRKNYDLTKTSYSIGRSFFHMQKKININFEDMYKYIKKNNCDYYFIKTGDDIVYFIRINSSLLSNDEQINTNLLMFNLYDYIYKQHMISNTLYKDDMYKLSYIKNVITERKIYFQEYQYFINKLETIPEIPINWVWFRYNNKKLTKEISERALSWIMVNPNSEFHLWSNLKDNNEFLEFIEDLDDNIKKIFISKITVHYNEEVVNIFNEFMDEYKESEYYDEYSYKLLNNEFHSTIKNSLIFKTDILRLMILYKFGGVYADFNDCLCLSPIKYIFLSHNIAEPLGVSDKNDLNHASNYFLYTQQGNNKWKIITFNMIKCAKDIIYFLKEKEMKEMIKAFCINLVKKMEIEDFELTDDLEGYDKLNTKYEQVFSEIPYLGVNPRPISLYYWKILIYNIINDLLDDSKSKETLTKILAQVRSRTKQRRNLRKDTKSELYNKINVDYELVENKFEDVYSFWWTDYSLNTIMHFTNLPIFCRMLKHDLYLLPFGYYMRFGCLLSYVCHLGDGGSYGYEKRNGYTANTMYN